VFTGRTLIPAPHGQLEAIYRPARADAARVALILHPHPLYGGTMHNKVVYHAARALEDAGIVTLRINFRGVGASTGTHDGGRGELDDARCGLDFLLAQQPRAEAVLVTGFSFGAAVALRFGCPETRVSDLIAIGTPARWLDATLLASCAKPITFIHGGQDAVAPLADLVKVLQAVVPRTAPTTQRVIADADHFFEGHLEKLREAVAEAVAA
jgi:alpha/beta superfamily hydrolase